MTTLLEALDPLEQGPFSYSDTKGDGVQKTFTFSFYGPSPAYLRKSDIRPFLRDSDPNSPTYQSYSEIVFDDNNWTIDGTQITFTTAIETSLDNENNIRIRRIMPKDEAYTTAQVGDIFREEVIVNSFLQQLYSQHEVLDGFTESAKQNANIDMNNFKLVNLSDGADPQDSVNKRQLDVVADAADATIEQAYKFANEAEDVPVNEAGYSGFSALHYAAKAEDQAILAGSEKDAAVIAKNQAEAAEEQAGEYRDFSREWATKTEDSPVNDGENPQGFSAFHWASKSESFANDAQITLSSRPIFSKTTADAKAKDNLTLESLVIIGERDFSLWEVVDINSVVVNEEDVLSCTVLTGFALLLKGKSRENPKAWGAIFDDATDIGPVLNSMLAKGEVPVIPSDPAVINTKVSILEKSHIIFVGSRLRTTDSTLSMFEALSVDDWSMIGSATLSGTAPAAASPQKLLSAIGCKNYIVENIKAVRSQGHGFFIGWDGTVDERGEHGTWNNCRALESQIGWEFEDGTSAEYTVLTGCSALANVVGVKNGAGNTNWSGGNIVDNTIGLDLYGGGNDNHGIFSGVNINHNTSSNLRAIDVGNGYTFDGCHFYADGPIGSETGYIFITNSKQLNFNGGTIACPVRIDIGAGTLNGTIVVKDAYVNVESWTEFTGTAISDLVCKGLYGDSGLLTQFVYPKPIAVSSTVGFLNGWGDYGNGRAPLTYQLTEDGVVKISGVINGGSTVFATVIAQLPLRYRPSLLKEFIVKEGDTAGPHSAAYIQVDSTGSIVWLSGSNQQVSIDIEYPLD